MFNDTNRFAAEVSSLKKSKSFLPFTALHGSLKNFDLKGKVCGKVKFCSFIFPQCNAITRDVYILMSNTSTDLFFPLSLSKVADELDFFK